MHLYRDGGLALTAYLAQNVGSGSVGMGKLNALNEQFRLNKDLKVLELGSGYGPQYCSNTASRGLLSKVWHCGPGPGLTVWAVSCDFD